MYHIIHNMTIYFLCSYVEILRGKHPEGNDKTNI